jgi:hypothetical protein
MELNYKKAIDVEKKKVIEDQLVLKWNNGVVYEYGPKSEETKKREKMQEEKRARMEIENSIHVQMGKAIAEIENRRLAYRLKDFEDYGYDKYTNEFYYEPESDEEEYDDSI